MAPPPASVAMSTSLDAAVESVSSSAVNEARLRRQAFLAVLLAAFCIGFSPVLVRYGDAGPAAIGFWRLFFALGPTALWAWAEHRAERRRLAASAAPRPLPIRAYAFAALAGVFFGADLIAFHIGLANTSTANGVLLGNLAVVFVLVFGWLFLDERPTRGLLLALATALAGTLFIILSSAGHSHGAGPRAVSVFGDMLCVAAALFYAGYMLMTRVVRRAGSNGVAALGGGMTALVATATGAVTCLIWAVATGEVLVPQSVQGLLAVVGLGIVAHATGQGLTTFALGRLPAGLISVVLLLQIVVGVTFAALLFGEIPSPMVIIGGTLVVAGVATARPGGRRA